MKRMLLIFSAILGCVVLSSAQPYVGWSTGYFTGYSNNNDPSKIDWNAYTHLCLFSLIPTSNGGLDSSTNTLDGAMCSDFITQCHNNGKKAIICCGGAGCEGTFLNVTGSASNRSKLVSNLVKFVKAYGFDGLDMDWEPSSDNGTTVSQYQALHQELRDSLDQIVPRVMLTAAIADNYPNCAASIADYCDQLNAMSYYGLVNDQDSYMANFTDLGVPKNKLGIGFGYDMDNEKDVNNPDDVAAKCEYAISNGYGGVMVWEIMRATVACQDTNAHYVNPAPVVPVIKAARAVQKAVARVSIGNNGKSASFTVSEGAGFVNVELYNAKGALVKTLISGPCKAGTVTVPLSVAAGAYFVKVTGASVRAGTGFFTVK